MYHWTAYCLLMLFGRKASYRYCELWYLKLHVRMHFLCLVTANIKDLHFLVFFFLLFLFLYKIEILHKIERQKSHWLMF